MDQNRVLELAVEELEGQKAGVEAEIESVRAELKGFRSATPLAAKAVAVGISKRNLKGCIRIGPYAKGSLFRLSSGRGAGARGVPSARPDRARRRLGCAGRAGQICRQLET
jgi:hypothetical protein